MCKQIDELAMESPLSLKLANLIIVFFKTNWLKDCPSDLPKYWKVFNDDIFDLFAQQEHLELFWNFVMVNILTYNL